tara:strand:- start:645 stop:887 length:243 start_codon:yes stop_codon:yes gene_type:complete
MALKFIEIKDRRSAKVWAYVEGRLDMSLREFYGPDYGDINRREVGEDEAKVTVNWEGFRRAITEGSCSIDKFAFCLGGYR